MPTNWGSEWPTDSLEDEEDDDVSPEVEAAFVEFLGLQEEGQAPPVGEFLLAHPECNANELRTILEAIVEVEHITGDDLSTQIEGGGISMSEFELRLAGGRYREERVLGRGGMGIVYLVHDGEMNRKVALKVVKAFPGEEGDNLKKMFLAEVLTSARLEHPNIVPVYDRGLTDDGLVYYTMRWVRGRNLSEIIAGLAAGDAEVVASFGRIRRLQILEQIAHGVAYAHEQGIAHLDLKPPNVMIGSFGEVLTLDWGLARPIDAPASDQGGGVIGTPGYMAPEQIANEPVNPRSDVFALGAILLECMTLEKAIPGQSTQEILENTMMGRLNEVNPILGLSEDLLDTVRRAMAVDPEDRFKTATELAEEVFRLIEGAQDKERKKARADQEVEEGSRLAQRYRHLRNHIAALRKSLAAQAEQVLPHWSLPSKEHLWRRRLRLEFLEHGLPQRFAQATARFHAALAFDPSHVNARRWLATLHWEEFKSAEASNDYRAGTLHMQEVKKYDDGSLAKAIEGNGKLWLRVRAPRDAAVTLRSLIDEGPLLVPGPVHLAGTGSLAFEEHLPMGRYIVVVSMPGKANLHYPMRIRRQAVVSPFLVIDERMYDDRMALIPAGSYDLGGDPEVADEPARTVELEDFMLARFPVTCGEYLEFLNEVMEQGPTTASLRVPRTGANRPLWERKGRTWALPTQKVFPYLFEPEAPVVGISWLDAQAYCEWMTDRDQLGRTFSLPTSDEWEAAARGGDGRIYPWGDRYDPCLANNRDSQKGLSHIEPVLSFAYDTSPFGIRGMGGNSSDWCQSYGARGNRQLRIVRGGNWNSPEDEVHLARVQTRRPDDTNPVVGFRLRCTISKPGLQVEKPRTTTTARLRGGRLNVRRGDTGKPKVTGP